MEDASSFTITLICWEKICYIYYIYWTLANERYHIRDNHFYCPCAIFNYIIFCKWKGFGHQHICIENFTLSTLRILAIKSKKYAKKWFHNNMETAHLNNRNRLAWIWIHSSTWKDKKRNCWYWHNFITYSWCFIHWLVKPCFVTSFISHKKQ